MARADHVEGRGHHRGHGACHPTGGGALGGRRRGGGRGIGGEAAPHEARLLRGRGGGESQGGGESAGAGEGVGRGGGEGGVVVWWRVMCVVCVVCAVCVVCVVCVECVECVWGEGEGGVVWAVGGRRPALSPSKRGN